MVPTDQFARHFPLIVRARPACLPLARRVADLSERAQHAERDNDLASASAVHNLAALLASDCGIPELARQWCLRKAKLHLRSCPLDGQAARYALEPLINLARLHIRAGDSTHAVDLINTLYAAVSTRTPATIDDVDIPAQLTKSSEAHQEVRRWLWAVVLATSARALAAAGRWEETHDHLRAHKGIGRRMFDGRQVAVIAHLTSGDTDSALTLLHNTERGEPWENAVTACLVLHCHDAPSTADADTLLRHFDVLDTSAERHIAFHTRLGLSLLDALGPTRHRAQRIAVELINRAIQTPDGYAARDILGHHGCRHSATRTQVRDLGAIVATCGLDRGILPHTMQTDLTTALARAEMVIARFCKTRQRA